MTADQVAKWKAAVAALHKQRRQQRGKRRKTDASDFRVGMVRRLPPRSDGDGRDGDGPWHD